MKFEILYETRNIKTFHVDAPSKEEAEDKLHKAWSNCQEDILYLVSTATFDESFNDGLLETRQLED